MSFDDYSFPFLYKNLNDSDNIDEKENENELSKIKSNEEGEEIEKNLSKIFYGKITQNEKDKISTNFITPEEEVEDINILNNDSNNKESYIEFNLNLSENKKKFENKEKKKFKILNKKPNRSSEKDAQLRRNLTIFKIICTKNINEKINEIKELKNIKYNIKNKKINLGSNKTEISNNFNKSLIEILSDENINK